MKSFVVIGLVAVLAAKAFAASTPVALVEQVNGSVTGVEFMDYVLLGQQIQLGPDDTLVLDYLASCWRETITGGLITAGAEQSEVQNGKIERHRVDCDRGKLALTPELAGQSAAMVVRGLKAEPQITLFGLSPVIEIKNGGNLLIERLDRLGEHLETMVSSSQLVRGAFYDLARVGKALTPNGIYRASVGEQQITFKIDPRAQPGASPLVGRLLRLRPAI
jgi:hypothetical protein